MAWALCGALLLAATSLYTLSSWEDPVAITARAPPRPAPRPAEAQAAAQDRDASSSGGAVSGRLSGRLLERWSAGGPAGGGRGFRMQLMSDLHLEFPGVYETMPRLEARAPVLALAGDIGSTRPPPEDRAEAGRGRGPAVSAYERFVHEQAERFEHVLVTSGNHELYMSVHDATLREIRRVCERAPRGNVHFLDRGTWEDPETGVRVVGATLWSHVPPRHAAYVQEAMNDYKYIFKVPPPAVAKEAVAARPELGAVPRESLVVPISVDDTNAWHAADVAYIRGEVARAEAAGAEVVVLTHHAPLMRGTATPMEESDPLNHAPPWLASQARPKRLFFDPGFVLEFTTRSPS